MMNRITIKEIVTTIPQNMLAYQRIVKMLPTLCKTFNALVNRITIQGIVTTIPYARAPLFFCKGYSSSLICTLLILGGNQCIDDRWIIDLSIIMSLFQAS
jgi:hypothetical protein